MGYTVCERLIEDKGDMSEIEDSIVRQMGGENHRCAFFRSVPYIRLRIAAIYFHNSLIPHVAYCGDLSVTLTPTTDGPVVRVHCNHEPTYVDDFEQTEAGGEAQIEDQIKAQIDVQIEGSHLCRKRTRE